MIKDKICNKMSKEEIADLREIFNAAFDTDNEISPLEHYLITVDKVLILYAEGKPAAFMFYQLRKIAGANVLHLSLSGKSTGSTGTQKKMGSYLFYKYLFSPFNLARINVFTTVSNNPRSYFNMHAIGEHVFPDVLEPEKPFKYPELYQAIARNLGMESVDKSGILRNRMQKLGFSIRADQTQLEGLDGKGLAFMNYIDMDASHGVLVMVAMRPIVDVPKYYGSQLGKALRRQGLNLKEQLIRQLDSQFG